MCVYLMCGSVHSFSFCLVVQKCITVFGQLLARKENVVNVLTFLSQHTCQGGGNGLAVLLAKWLDNHENLSPPYLKKISIVALMNILEVCLNNPTLGSMAVNGDVVENSTRVTRSARRRGAPGLGRFLH